jgi:hypothetical protein
MEERSTLNCCEAGSGQQFGLGGSSMAQGPDRKRSRLFISFSNDVRWSKWVDLAMRVFARHFDVYDYRKRPENDPDLQASLRGRVASSDVFICLLSEDYHQNPTTWTEFQDAVELATGERLGSLRTGQRRRPLVYVVTCDDWAVQWIETNHPQFAYLQLSQYSLRLLEPDTVVPENEERWHDWLSRIQDRLAALSLADGGGERAVVGPAPNTQLVVFGRPNGSFGPSVACALGQLVAGLEPDISYHLVPDGWHDQDHPSAARAARTVAAAASSLLIQPCDAALYEDNRIEDNPLGTDLRLKLQRTGLPRVMADATLTRTLFWVPQVQSHGNGSAVDASAIRSLDSTTPGPWFCYDAVAEMLTWLRERLGNPALIVKAEDGISDVGPLIRKGLTQYFNPLLFETVRANAIPGAIRQAAAEKSPILVAINDRGINGVTANPRFGIHRRAEQFDREIGREIAGIPGPRIARAIFLLHYPERFEGHLTITADQEWVLLPLDMSHNYNLEPARLEKIREALELRNE